MRASCPLSSALVDNAHVSCSSPFDESKQLGRPTAKHMPTDECVLDNAFVGVKGIEFLIAFARCVCVCIGVLVACHT